MNAVGAKVEVSMGDRLFDLGIVSHGSALRIKTKPWRCARGWGDAPLKRYNPHIIY
jgi:hypothetical protein